MNHLSTRLLFFSTRLYRGRGRSPRNILLNSQKMTRRYLLYIHTGFTLAKSPSLFKVQRRRMQQITITRSTMILSRHMYSVTSCSTSSFKIQQSRQLSKSTLHPVQMDSVTIPVQARSFMHTTTRPSLLRSATSLWISMWKLRDLDRLPKNSQRTFSIRLLKVS